MKARCMAIATVAFLSACSVQPWKPSRTTGMDEHMAHMSAADMRTPNLIPQGQRPD